MTVLCWLEIDADGVTDSSSRALAMAGRLARSANEDLAVAWFGEPGAIAAGELQRMVATSAFAIASEHLAGYAPVAWARALAGLAAGLPGEAGGPGQACVAAPVSAAPGSAGPVSAVIAAATDRGNEVLAHLGAITGLPMAANVISATRTAPGQCRLVRQRWAGSLLEEAVLDAPLALLTVAADAADAALADPVPAGAGSRVVSVLRYVPELVVGDLLVRATESAGQRAGASLASARVVIGGGRGVGGPDGFAVLEELADLLGAVVGVSRVVTSEGWRPHRQQVGQTGTKIRPELYLACGISGAIQHMAGCQGAKTIVAINIDPGAPIVAKADYAVIGDLHQVIPALIEALRARREGNNA